MIRADKNTRKEALKNLEAILRFNEILDSLLESEDELKQQLITLQEQNDD